MTTRKIAGTLLILAAGLPAVHAQSTTDSAEADESIQDIVITGSRIARKDFVGTSPIITADERQLKETGKVNVESALQQLPQFAPARDENDNAEASGGGGRA